MSMRLRTRIVTTREDWSVARIELLGNFQREHKEGPGTALFAVAAADREPLESADPFLSILDRDEFDALWLTAADPGVDLSPEKYEGSSRSHRSDRGLLLTSEDIGRRFNVAMAFEISPAKGRLIVDCNFQHLADERAALTSVRIYVRNLATWLALLESDELESLAMKRSVTGLWRWSSQHGARGDRT